MEDPPHIPLSPFRENAVVCYVLQFVMRTKARGKQQSMADRWNMNTCGQFRVVFIKLGGSLISDKTKPETLREEVLDRIARELREAISEISKGEEPTRVVVGHGSGSFGHVAAAKHGTIEGVSGRAQWKGFCDVSDAASRLNRLVTAALLKAGVPAMSLQPAASAICRGGKLISLATAPITAALEAGIVPVIHGDVAFDQELGGTVASTEEIFSFLAREMVPRWLLLAGETEGVFGADGTCVSEISPESLPSIEASLGGSRGTDVTGGMASKVRGMLSLVESLPGTRIRIFSGLDSGCVRRALLLAAGKDSDEPTSWGGGSSSGGGWSGGGNGTRKSGLGTVIVAAATPASGAATAAAATVVVGESVGN